MRSDRESPKKDSGLVVDAFLEAVKDTLAPGDHIEIRGFSTFKVRHGKARTARNPRTGEPVEVPPRVAPVFTPSRKLHDRVDRASACPGRNSPSKLLPNQGSDPAGHDDPRVGASLRRGIRYLTEPPRESTPPHWRDSRGSRVAVSFVVLATPHIFE